MTVDAYDYGPVGPVRGLRHTFALGLPHTPWVPERVVSYDRLRAQLLAGAHTDHVRVFDERESNRVWSQKLWRWGVSTGASHLLQLQDDVVVAPNFWPALRAMVTAVPDQIIGLEAAHPLGPEMRRTGRAWYRTRAWLVGVGYVFPVGVMLDFLAWCDVNPDRVATTNEDSLLSHWAASIGRDIWHPVPTILDHDLGVPSTYGNDAHHEWSLWRKPTVTWRDVERPAALEDPAYWRLTEPPLLPGPGTEACWFCGSGKGELASQDTGCRLCRLCVLRVVGSVLGVQVSAGAK